MLTLFLPRYHLPFVLLRQDLFMSLELPGSAGSTGSEFQDPLVPALSTAVVIDMCHQARCGCWRSEPRPSSSQGKASTAVH